MEISVISAAPVQKTVSRCAQFRQQAPALDMAGLKSAGARSIKLGSKFVSICGVNKNEIFFTKDAAMSFLRRFIK